MKKKNIPPFDVRGFSFSTGFTIIELIMVTSIIAILMTFVLITFPGSQKRAKDLKRQDDLKQYTASLARYSINTNGVYPTAATTIGLTTLCATLGLTGASCPDDIEAPIRRYYYQTSNDGVNFVVWGELEATPSAIWVLCSNGLTGATSSTTIPTNGVCPI